MRECTLIRYAPSIITFPVFLIHIFVLARRRALREGKKEIMIETGFADINPA